MRIARRVAAAAVILALPALAGAQTPKAPLTDNYAEVNGVRLQVYRPIAK